MEEKPDISSIHHTYTIIPDSLIYPSFQWQQHNNPEFTRYDDYVPYNVASRSSELVEAIKTRLPSCMKHIDEEYVERLLQEPDRLVLYIESSEGLEGIVIAHYLHEESVYNEYEGDTVNVPAIKIEILCGSPRVKGVGTNLVKQIKRICDLVNIRYITLSSLTEAVPFYLKTDFECVGECSLQMNVRKGGRRRSRINRRKTRRRQRTLRYNRRKST